MMATIRLLSIQGCLRSGFVLLLLHSIESFSYASSSSTTQRAQHHESSKTVPPLYHIPSFTVHELQSGEQDDQLKQILTSTGILSIRVPLTQQDTSTTKKSHLLQSLCKCNPSDFSSIANSDSQILADGLTTRSTIATASRGSSLPLSLPKNDITKYCGDGVYESLEKTRDYVSIASLEAFIPALDRLIQDADNKEADNVLLSTFGDKDQYSTVASIVEDANHLEHFHLYSKESTDSSNHEAAFVDNSLGWHTDGGLFLAFIPGTLCHDINDLDDSFRILLRNEKDVNKIETESMGTEMGVVFPESDGDEIVVAIMLGAGSEHWLNTSLKLRATQHAVKMKGGDTRAWYGMSKFFIRNY